MKIIGLDTDKGVRILESLKRNGWKKVDEYSCFAFDKGIDFDSYTLEKGCLKLVFEWTNWFEWEVSGSNQAVEEIAQEFSLEVQGDADT